MQVTANFGGQSKLCCKCVCITLVNLSTATVMAHVPRQYFWSAAIWWVLHGLRWLATLQENSTVDSDSAHPSSSRNPFWWVLTISSRIIPTISPCVDLPTKTTPKPWHLDLLSIVSSFCSGSHTLLSTSMVWPNHLLTTLCPLRDFTQQMPSIRLKWRIQRSDFWDDPSPNHFWRALKTSLVKRPRGKKGRDSVDPQRAMDSAMWPCQWTCEGGFGRITVSPEYSKYDWKRYDSIRIGIHSPKTLG